MSEEVIEQKAEAEVKEENTAKVETRDPRDNRDSRDNRPKPARMPKFRKKVCRFCENSELVPNYKDVDMMEKFITDRGKILPRRVTGNCAKHQRAIAREVKKARALALLPYTVK